MTILKLSTAEWLWTYKICFFLTIEHKEYQVKLTPSRDSAVGIATGYGLDDREAGVRSPVVIRFFFLSSSFNARLPTCSPTKLILSTTKTEQVGSGSFDNISELYSGIRISGGTPTILRRFVGFLSPSKQIPSTVIQIRAVTSSVLSIYSSTVLCWTLAAFSVS
jgi:hypothetical protein